jgi:16S rRNA (adenine1518-N6/adenine1519-N6)-dimethyltransferase
LTSVRAKKSLGQHFLTDKNIARNIVNSLTLEKYRHILEIGPGMGVLTEFLLEIPGFGLRFAEIDPSSIDFLTNRFAGIDDKIIPGDALMLDLKSLYDGPVALIGNFPYNISSQLFFKILESRNLVPEVVCMVQKEVAVRIASPPGSRDYGILSVLLQSFYKIEYLFGVPPQVFNPPPKVQSAVIRLRRNDRQILPCDEGLFVKVVKTAFNQRRKMLRNSLKSMLPQGINPDLMLKRPEQLDVNDFILLTQLTAMNKSG